MSDKRYMIFRVYSKKERPESTPDERVVFYGWTRSKNVVKAFKEQRDEKKYVVHKMSEDDITRMFSEDVTDVETMIDYIKLRSVQTQEEVIFFSTANELRTAEINIQRMMKDLCEINDELWDMSALKMFLALEDYYADALHYIGFRPPEIDIMFPSAGGEGTLEDTEELIDAAYDGIMVPPEEVVSKRDQPLGLSTLGDVSTKILYSLEAFIKVLKDEL